MWRWKVTYARLSELVRMLGSESERVKPSVAFASWLSRTVWVVVASVVMRIGVLAQESPPIVWERQAHNGAIYDLAFSPDGQLIATAGADGVIKLWRASDGEPIATLSGHTSVVSSVAFSPDGSYLASGSWDCSIRVWSVVSRDFLFALSGHTAAVSSVQFSADGTRLVSGSWDGTVRIWDFVNRRVARTLRGHTDWVHEAVLSPNGALIASAGRDGTVRLWRASDGALLRTLTGHQGYVFAVAFTPDSAQVVSGGWDTIVRVWRVLDGELQASLSGHGDWITRVAFTPDGLLLFSAGWDRTLRVWSTVDGSLVNTYTRNLGTGVRALAFTPAGEQFAYGTADGKLILARNELSEFRFQVLSVVPNIVHQQPSVVLTINGSGFEPGATVRFERPNTNPLVPISVQVQSSFRIQAQFDFSNAPVGDYAVVVRNPNGQEARLANALTVQAGAGTPSPFFEIQSEVQEIRDNRTYNAEFVYGNFGTAPMDAPLFVIRADPPVPMRLSSDSAWSSEPLLVLCTGRLVGGRLMPGEIIRLPVQFRSETTANQIRLIAERVTGIDASLFANNWATLRQQLRPEGVDEAIWQQFWNQFVAQIGTNETNFLRALRQAAAAAVRNGYFEPRVQALIQYYWFNTESVGFDPPTFHADLAVQAPDMPVVLMRMMPTSILARSRPTAFGRGWTHAYEIRLRQRSPQEVVIYTPFGDRVFTKYSADWMGQEGETGRLFFENGVWRLQESDGTELFFSADGLLTRIRRQNRDALTFEYAGNRLTRVLHAAGGWIRLLYNAQGLVIRAETSTGQAVSYAYQDGLLTTVTMPGDRVMRYEYHTASEGLRSYALRRIIYPDNTEFLISYDSVGRIASTSLKNGINPVVYERTAIDEIRVRNGSNATTIYRFLPNGLISYVRTPAGREFRYVYDSAGRVIRAIDPDGGEERYVYDANGNPIQTQSRDGVVRTYSFDPQAGTLQWVRDGRQVVTRFTHDPARNLTRIEYADSSAESFSYSVWGQVLQAINRRGQAVTFNYDSAGRPTQIQMADGRVFLLEYDSAGRLSALRDSLLGITRYSYDSRGFLTQVTDPNGRWIRYEYNNAGQRTRRQTWDGTVVVYEYDVAGRLQRLRDGTGALIVEYTYDAAGRLQRERFGNGCSVAYEHDADGLVRAVNHYSPAGALIARYAYTYDILGRPIAVQTPLGNYTYAYDAIGQLVGIQYPDGSTATAQYDAEWNRIAINEGGVITTYTVNNLNQYLQAGNTTFQYDSDGNLIRQVSDAGVRLYEWNAAGQLTRIVLENGEVWTFAYDAWGRRVRMTRGNEVRQYVYDGDNLYAELDGNGNVIARYVHGYGLVARADSSGVYYYGYDILGHTVLLTNAVGAVANRYEYKPFGGYVLFQETVPNPFRFAGRYGVMEDMTGLIYARARYYDPNIGRFISPDPSGFADAVLNLYQYAENAPTYKLDYVGEPVIFAIPIVVGGGLAGKMVASAILSAGLQIGVNIVTGAKWNEGLLESAILGAITVPGAQYIARSARPFIERIVLRKTVEGRQLVEVGRKILRHERTVRSGERWDIGFAVHRLPNLYQQAKNLLNQVENIVEAWVSKIDSGINWFVTAFTTGWSLIAGFMNRQPTSQQQYNIRRAYDPNEKLGRRGFGAQGWIAPPTEAFVYDIYFENLPTAQAWAQEVIITDYLDVDLDRSTFELLDIVIANQVINDLAGTQGGRIRVPLQNSNLVADIQVTFNRVTGQVRWVIRSIDPLTNDLPPEIDRGLLPPNNPQLGNGEGRVSFRIAPRRDRIRHGTQFTNQARIVFDVNPPIDTNVWVNTIDAIPPTATITPSEHTGSAPVQVRWSGEDVGSGVRDYTVYVSINGDPYRVWIANTTATEATYTPPRDGVFVFAVVARDNVGNQPPPPRIAVDVNGDGCVNNADLLAVLFAFGTTGNTPADVTGDGVVNNADLLLVLFNFGRGCE